MAEAVVAMARTRAAIMAAPMALPRCRKVRKQLIEFIGIHHGISLRIKSLPFPEKDREGLFLHSTSIVGFPKFPRERSSFVVPAVTVYIIP